MQIQLASLASTHIHLEDGHALDGVLHHRDGEEPSPRVEEQPAVHVGGLVLHREPRAAASLHNHAKNTIAAWQNRAFLSLKCLDLGIGREIGNFCGGRRIPRCFAGLSGRYPML